MEKIILHYNTRTYWRLHSKDVLLSALPWLTVLGAGVYLSYDSILLQARSDWANNRCNPIYLPFAGVIAPQQGKSTTRTTVDNFNYCVKQDLGEVFRLLLLPLEFAAFTILSAIDLVIESIMLAISLSQKLKNIIGGVNANLQDKLTAMLIPIVLFIAKIRDTLAKVNAVLLTAVLTTATISNIIVSGMLSMTTILCDLLIAFALVIAGLFATSVVLMNPFTFPVGLALFAAANVMLTAIFIPTVVMYSLVQAFMSATFGKQAAPAPNVPFVPKLKIPKIELPKIKLPEIKLPEIKKPEIKLPDVKKVEIKSPFKAKKKK